MLIVILLIAGFTIFNFFYGKNDHSQGFLSRVRLAFVQMLLAGGFLVYISTELLSFFDHLNTASIFCFWAFVTAGFGYFNFRENYWQFKISDLRGAWCRLTPKMQWLFGGGLIVYLIPLLFLAVYAPPNNTDSANYHLARVVFWLQNQNVKHFPTVYIQQLYHNVFSEYILLHFMALNGWNDYFVNLVQWLAMLGSVFAIGLVGKQLGLGLKSQLFVSILQLTYPIGILESTTTQNDYIAGFLFLAFLYFGLCLMQQKSNTQLNIFWLSVALSLGGFNKYTVFLFGFPICVWIGIVLLKKLPFKYSIRTVLVASMFLIVVFTPFFKRNYDLFGNVLSSTKGTPLFTEEVATEQRCIGCVMSVTLKNLTAHLGLPFQDYNDKIDHAVTAVHHWLGVSLNGPELNVDDYYTRFVIQEDMSHNPWHFVLIVVGAVWLLFQKKQRDFKILLLCAITGFVLFSALIKYQIYNSRVEMPFFAMGFLWTGLMMSHLHKKWMNATVVLFLLLGLPYIYTNYTKTVFPLRQLSKYVLGYIPPFLCVKDGNVELYQKAFNKVYDFAHPQPCFALKASPNYWERLRLISQLKDLGYYKTEEQAFWEKSREANYFNDMYHQGLYTELKYLTSKLDPNTQGVGALYANVLGFYREWLLIKNQLYSPVPMQYVLYQEECKKTPNAARKFVYDYVLLDHSMLVKKYLNESQIDTVFSTQHFVLVKLKTPTTQQYTYISREEVQEYETRQ